MDGWDGLAGKPGKVNYYSPNKCDPNYHFSGEDQSTVRRRGCQAAHHHTGADSYEMFEGNVDNLTIKLSTWGIKRRSVGSWVMIEGLKLSDWIFKSANNNDSNLKYGEPSDWEDLGEVKAGVKGGEAAAAVVAAEGGDDDYVKS